MFKTIKNIQLILKNGLICIVHILLNKPLYYSFYKNPFLYQLVTGVKFELQKVEQLRRNSKNSIYPVREKNLNYKWDCSKQWKLMVLIWLILSLAMIMKPLQHHTYSEYFQLTRCTIWCQESHEQIDNDLNQRKPNQPSILVGIDISRAFDKVSQGILLQQLWAPRFHHT